MQGNNGGASKGHEGSAHPPKQALKLASEAEMNQRSSDKGQRARMVENEPLTQEILRQISVIQSEIKGISTALETLARVEERQAATRDVLERYWITTEKNTRAISNLEASFIEMKRESNSRLEVHALWGLVAAATGAVGFLLKLVLVG